MNRIVSIVDCKTYEEKEVASALKELLEPLGGLSWVTPGMKIAIKANLVSMLKPEAAATTHPMLLCVLIQMLKERGAEVIVGDSPGGLFNGPYLERIYSVTGMKAAEAAGARLNRNFSVKEAHFPEALAAKTFSYTGWLDEADAIINFCKLKTHGMMGMSGAAKNMFGVVPGTTKPEYHYRFPNPRDFARMILDLDAFFKPRLNIVDGVVGMEGNGPTAGTPRSIGLLMASESPHAVDLIGAAVIGVEPETVPTLAAAIEVGLIPGYPEEIETIGIPWAERIIPDFQRVVQAKSLRFNRDSEKFFGRISSAFLDKALASVPKLHASECVGCRECFKICPAKAIEMKNKKPIINRQKCIRCFCCQEFCPKGAMKVHRPLIARLLK